VLFNSNAVPPFNQSKLGVALQCFLYLVPVAGLEAKGSSFVIVRESA
jgi:hypothetical protein